MAVTQPSGTWVHYAATRNVSTNEVIFYENGFQLGTTQSYTNDPTGGTSASLTIGRVNTADLFNFPGRLEEMAFVLLAAFQSWVQQNMFKQVDPATSGLAANWRFNENTGTTTYDETTNNNDGTLVASPSTPTWITGLVPDHYNEAEAAYTVSASGDQINIDIDGDTNVSNSLNGAVSAGASLVTLSSSTGFPDGADVTDHVAFIDGDKFTYNDVNGNNLEGIPATGENAIIGHAT